MLRQNFLAVALIWLASQIILFYPAICQANQSKTALRLEIKGAIGPAVAEYIKDGLAKAADEQAALVILQMDTPGGLDTSMRQIIKGILASKVPVVCYVAPAGSRAASAGTYILYASHVAAMAPATNLGAATPIRIGGIPGLPDKPKPLEEQKDEETAPPPDALERKMINDAEAYIKALAHRHGRNAQWAARAVREAVSLTAEEALAEGVIDLVATNLKDLLSQLDQREVILESGKMILATSNLTIKTFEADWRIRLLTVITDPNIAYLLMLIGIYGLIFELTHPGFILPGVAGAIALLLALYTFQILPINYAGLALIILGIVFMIAEAFVPSFGALGFGGLIAFVAGSVILMDDEGLRISLALIAATAMTSAAFLLLLVGKVYTMSRKKVVCGPEELLGSIGEAMTDFEGKGRIWIHGESWQAQTSTPIRKNQQVRVTGQHGLELTVEILEEEH
ncbi:MAG: nodulation protein NfeD [Thermodesulfobacteriota bacterium]